MTTPPIPPTHLAPGWAWLQALAQPQQALAWTLPEWERVVRLARRLRLLARLAQSLKAQGLLDQVPPQARAHLMAELRVSDFRSNAMTWVLERVATTLGPVDHPLVLLKGGAYLGQGLPNAAGRLPSDVDILVPLANINAVQAALLQAGWEEPQLDEHDQHYYRAWSHELPPLQHPLHPLELDLHHNILPPVAKTHVDVAPLLARLLPSRWPAWQVFHPIDQVLHCAAHLFLDPEPVDRLRDIVDLDALMRHFGAAPAGHDFWAELAPRAAALGLTEPLALAAHFSVAWLGTPIPGQVAAQIQRQGPGHFKRWWLTGLFTAVLTPTEPDAMPSAWHKLAAQVVLARYHQQRLPWRLLLPHLWRKMKKRRADAAAVLVPPQTDVKR